MQTEKTGASGPVDRETVSWMTRARRVLAPLAVLTGMLACAGLLWFAVGRLAGGGSVAKALSAIAVALMGAGIAGGFLIGWLARSETRRTGEAGAPPAETPEPPEHRELLERIIDSMEGGVMTISSEGTVTSFNSVAQKTLGCCARDVVGRHFSVVFGNVSKSAALCDMINASLTTQETFSSAEVSAMAAGGSTVALGVTISLLRGEWDGHSGIVLTFKNLADLKRIRDQVQRTQQLASLGRLAAGMAHEIRNPLGSLHGLVELIQEDFAADDPKRRYTGTILRTIDQLNSLVENLLEFSQPPVTQLDPHDVRGLVRESVQFCAFEQRDRDVFLCEDYGKEPVIVLADAETLGRAVLNIVRNAFQATPDGGTVSVSVRNRAPFKPGGQEQAVVAVNNTGSHILPEDREKLFTPFFTTKSDGTGLGLAIANQTISAHSGRIEVESEPVSGTTFNIVLPAAPSAASAAPPYNTRIAAYDREGAGC